MRVCTLRSLLMLGVAVGGCGGDPIGIPVKSQGSSVSFRVDGAVIDKVTCDTPRTEASGCDPTPWIKGSTLGATFNLFSGSSTSVGTTFSIRAFDGPRQYPVDGTKEGGSFNYNSDVGNGSGGRLSFGIEQGDTARCTFEIDTAPASLEPGDVVTGTFHCEGLKATRYEGGKYVDQRVNLTEGSMHLVIDH